MLSARSGSPRPAAHRLGAAATPPSPSFSPCSPRRSPRPPFFTHGKLPQSAQVPASLAGLAVQTTTAVVYLSFAARRGVGSLRADFGLRLSLTDSGWFLVGLGLGVRRGDPARPDRRRRAPEPAGQSSQSVVRVFQAAHGYEGGGSSSSPCSSSPPLGEELLFRGALLRALVRRTNPTAAVAISALVFALVHVGARPGRRLRRPRPLPPRPRLGGPGAQDRGSVQIVPAPRRFQPARGPPDPALARPVLHKPCPQPIRAIQGFAPPSRYDLLEVWLGFEVGWEAAMQCPSCIQGFSRGDPDAGLGAEPDVPALRSLRAEDLDRRRQPCALEPRAGAARATASSRRRDGSTALAG